MSYTPRANEVYIGGTNPGLTTGYELWYDTSAPDPSGSAYLPLTGGAMSGPIVLSADPTTGLHPATRQYVDARPGRNVIRNGDMSVAQRGNGAFTSGYGIDGWAQESNGTMSTTRVVQSPGLGSPQMVMAVSGQSAAANFAAMWAVIEDVNTLSGQTATVSFMAKANSGTPKLSLVTWQGFGTGGSPSAAVSTAFGTAVTLSTTMTRYTVTGTVPSVLGKTLGTTRNDSLQVGFHLSAGTTSPYYAASGNLGLQNNTFTITDVQMEAGSAATAFEKLPYWSQLQWCWRYYWRYDASVGGGTHVFSGVGVNTTKVFFGIPFPIRMRGVPVLTSSGVGSSDGSVQNKTGGTFTLYGPPHISDQGALCAYDHPTGATQQHWPEILSLNGVGSYFAFSAEV